MGHELESEYIIRRNQKSLSLIHNKGRMQLYRDIIMGHYREKRYKNTISYSGIAYIHDI